MEIFSRVLDEYDVPHDKIAQFINELREENYGMFQRIIQDKEVTCNIETHVPPSEANLIKVSEGVLDGEILKSDIEKKFGVKILSIIRDKKNKKQSYCKSIYKNGRHTNNFRFSRKDIGDTQLSRKPLMDSEMILWGFLT